MVDSKMENAAMNDRTRFSEACKEAEVVADKWAKEIVSVILEQSGQTIDLALDFNGLLHDRIEKVDVLCWAVDLKVRELMRW